MNKENKKRDDIIDATRPIVQRMFPQEASEQLREEFRKWHFESPMSIDADIDWWLIKFTQALQEEVKNGKRHALEMFALGKKEGKAHLREKILKLPQIDYDGFLNKCIMVKDILSILKEDTKNI